MSNEQPQFKHPWDSPQAVRAVFKAFEQWSKAYHKGQQQLAKALQQELKQLTEAAKQRECRCKQR